MFLKSGEQEHGLCHETFPTGTKPSAKTVQTVLPITVYKQFRDRAFEEGRTTQALLLEAVQAYLRTAKSGSSTE